ncbi:ABC transporter B family member 19-like [Olea europaea var. sylvestris]|uniref:ABC transporter B family member 19-like n=1 Tax=Olea europaea var. sylvestris TaxID=158386 RepID=UPI000C1CF434|nr:ABC transporter B family member 19-like [Olea europaea var. sylvestris]
MAETAEGKAVPDVDKKKELSLSFYQLFSFADKYDIVLMTCGTLGAIIHGSSMPVFFLLFGEMVNGFGKNQMDLHQMTHEVSKYALYFVYLGLVVCFSSYAEIACWMYTGERQVSALRKKYLEAVLKQDVGFFDTDARTGDIVFSVSTDTLLVQDAISEKVLSLLVYRYIYTHKHVYIAFSRLYVYLYPVACTPLLRDPCTVEAAASAANAHSFITLLPNGYNTQVGERGIQLSGGQKQRIAIARAMLKNPKILLLDEATSALDAGSESIVQEALDRLMVGRTTVIIAHRLSTIRNVDSIAVIQQGQVVETGSHEELIAKAGAYASLIRFQEMVGNRDFSNPSTRRTRSSRLSHSLSTKSLSLRSGSLRNLSYSYSTGADGRIEMVSNAETDRKNPAPAGYFSRLLKLNAPEWPYSILGAIGSVLSGFIGPTFAIVMSNMIEVFYYRNPASMERKTKEYVFIYIGAGLYAVMAYLIQHYFFSIMGENLTTRVRRMMLAAILRNEVGWFDEEENNSSLLAARLATDAADVKSAIAERISVILQNMTSLLTSFIVAFIVEWRVSLLILATFPLLVLANFAQQLSLKGFAGDTAKAHAKTSMIAGEGVSNIRTVAAFNAQEKVLSLFCHELRVPRQQSLRRSQSSGFLFGLSQLALYASEALILWYGAHLVSKGVSTFSKVIKVFVVLVITANSVAETVSLAPEIIRGGEAVGSVFSILDRSTGIDPDDSEAEPVESIRGEIELRHVDFAYPSRPDVIVFKDLSLRIRVGQSQALVGASGSGKSSVIALIERFYDPMAGKVMIDGKDIRRFNLKSLRQKIGLVQQEPALFAASILDNIAYGKDGATEAEVIEAARAANVHTFVSGLPEGYKTPVGERGVQLSGGQKQRIAIARAVLKDPSILLLDEATSALDAESESVLQEALERLMRGRTTVLVAHRLSTIRRVDSIGVVQDGRIVEQGSHSDLISRQDGAYFRLLQLQHQHI